MLADFSGDNRGGGVSPSQAVNAGNWLKNDSFRFIWPVSQKSETGLRKHYTK